MGEDKALLPFEGKSLLETLHSRAGAYFDEVVLLSASRQYDTDLRFIPDARTDAGPLGGLLSAMMDDSAGQTHIAVIPVDLPMISEQTLIHIAHGEIEPALQALVARAGDSIQPLAGVYRTDLVKQLEDYLDGGERQVMGFLDRLEHAFFDVPHKDILNINTPRDYKEL